MAVWDVLFLPIYRKLNALLEGQARIENQIGHIRKQQERLMATSKNIQDALQKLNDATNGEAAQLDAVQTKLDDLKSQIAGGVSSDEAQSIVDSLTSISDKVSSASDRLKEMAADPLNPVPTPAPPVD